VFLYPSLRESFGIPMLEAMSCGVPVITSNTSSMPEIAGDAALIIDPFKPEQITDALIKITTLQPLKNLLIERGLLQSAKFSWKAMANDVLEIYNQIGSSLPK
jgi:glycosyltransferase involved in cell wall biosynthesis